MKKFFIIFTAALLLIAGALFIDTGFQKRTDVHLQKYAVSEDGSSITVQTMLSGSMGWIRAIETERRGGAIYCSFYRAFGLSIGIGARNRYKIQLDPSSTEIYFDHGSEGYELVLQKDEASGAWTPCNEYVVEFS